MAAQETITMVGIPKDISRILVHSLVQTPYRLLLIATDADQFIQQLLLQVPQTAVETIDCVREGCWEADIIILADTSLIDKALIEKIKEVSIQKIVVYISEHRVDRPPDFIESKDLQILLPYSKIVWVSTTQASTEAAIAGADQTAVDTIVNILAQSGYQTTLVEQLPENRSH